jgi:hypothetical protein
MLANIYCHHQLCGVKNSEDIDENFEADQYFLEKIDCLRKGKHMDVGKAALDFFDSDTQLVKRDVWVLAYVFADL